MSEKLEEYKRTLREISAAHSAALSTQLHSLSAMTGNLGTELEHIASQLEQCESAEQARALGKELRIQADGVNRLAQAVNKVSATDPVWPLPPTED